MKTIIIVTLAQLTNLNDEFGSNNINTTGKLLSESSNTTPLFEVVLNEEQFAYTLHKFKTVLKKTPMSITPEDTVRELEPDELLAETLSNVEGLTRELADAKKEYSKACNTGISEGKMQSQDEICRLTTQLNTERNEYWNTLQEMFGSETIYGVDIGDNVTDDLTGFTGILTRVTEFTDGSFQGMIERLGDAKSIWFELDRLKLQEK